MYICTISWTGVSYSLENTWRLFAAMYSSLWRLCGRYLPYLSWTGLDWIVLLILVDPFNWGQYIRLARG